MKVTLDLPEDAFSSIRESPENFTRQMRLAAAVKWYELKRISQEKAADLAGISRAEFIDALREFGVSAIQTTPDELRREANM